MTDRNRPPAIRGHIQAALAATRVHLWGIVERYAHRRGNRALTDAIWRTTRR